jgi:two-component system, OmpR family, alkaline phosphatase synthesis response regulator PhoP
VRNARYKVLIADDDPSISKLLERTLRTDGYQVFVATDGEQAVDFAVKYRPDLVILDLTMPKMDGYEVTRALRRWDETRNACIILLTAHPQEDSAAKGFEEGADDYLVKPFTPAHLRARVQTWLLRRSPPGQQDDDATLEGEVE